MSPLHKRIVESLRAFPECKALYSELMYKVWPPEKYPRAHRCGCNGGPPGVAMAFGKALRLMEKDSVLWRPNRHYKRFGQPDIQLLGKWKNDETVF